MHMVKKHLLLKMKILNKLIKLLIMKKTRN